MRRSQSPLRPVEEETLATFLRRVQDARGIRNDALARRLFETDGSKRLDSWLRQVKAWRSSNGPKHLDAANADCLAKTLDADFTAFVFDPTDRSWRDMLTELREGLAAVTARVAAIEDRLRD